MRSLYLPAIFNFLISTVAVFILCSLALTYLKVVEIIKIVVAITFSLLLGAHCYFETVRKRKNKIFVNDRSVEIKACAETLTLLPKTKQSETFTTLFQSFCKDFDFSDGYYLVNGVCVIPCLKLDDFTFDEAKALIETCPFKSDVTIIISNGFTKNLTSFSDSLNLTLIKTEEVVPLLIERKLIGYEKPPKQKKDNLFFRLFKKANGTKTIIYGGTMIVFSFFVFYPVYYLVSGTIFIVFGLIAKFFGRSADFFKEEKSLKKLLNLPEKENE